MKIKSAVKRGEVSAKTNRRRLAIYGTQNLAVSVRAGDTRFTAGLICVDLTRDGHAWYGLTLNKRELGLVLSGLGRFFKTKEKVVLKYER